MTQPPKKRLLPLLVMLCLIVTTVSAQDTAPTNLFTDAVEIVSVRAAPEPTPIPDYWTDRETVEPLPADIQAALPGYPVAYSPDKEWVILQANNTFFAYHLSDGTLNELGVVVPADNLTEDPYLSPPRISPYWISSSQGMIVDPSQHSYFRDVYYVFDAAQPGSLQKMVSGFGDLYRDSPPRFEYVDTTDLYTSRSGLSIPHHNCQLTVYDTFGLREFDLGYDCYLELRDIYTYFCDGPYRIGDDYIYLRYDDEESPAVLTYLDTSTGDLHNLYQADIEKIWDVSPDGRFIAVLMDHNSTPYLRNTSCGDFPDAPIDTVFDNANLFIFYLNDDYQVQPIYKTDFGFSHIVWGTESILIVQHTTAHHLTVGPEGDGGVFSEFFPSVLHWLEVREENGKVAIHAVQMTDTNLGDTFLAASPDLKQVLLFRWNWSVTPRTAELTVADWRTLNIATITQPDVHFEEAPLAIWQTQDTFTLTIDNIEYTLRLKPDLFE